MSHLKSISMFLLGSVFSALLIALSQNSSNLNAVIQERSDQSITFAGVGNDMKSVSSSSSACNTGGQKPSAFDTIAKDAYQIIIQEHPNLTRNEFDLKSWDKRTSGGLMPSDRMLLAKTYRAADSVFEYGLGESTYIANYVGVPRYAGIDSDPNWVAMARDQVDDSFRFYLADIGPTQAWGYPDKELAKQVYNYQIAPLQSEPMAFDVYMVDGRFRFPCVLASFLHAADRGADRNHTKVLLHDCGKKAEWQPQPQIRKNYHAGDHLLDMVDHSGNKLCLFQRKPETTDEQLLQLWMELKLDVNR